MTVTFSGHGAEFVADKRAFTGRVALAAPAVVADRFAENIPGAPAKLDWDATLKFRHHLWSYGFGVAEAMDAAQRGAGLDYPVARELIRRSAAEARTVGGKIVAGVSTDQLPAGPATIADIRKAYAEQLEEVQAAGATPVVMGSPHLAAAARGADDYRLVYGELLDKADGQVLVQWPENENDALLGIITDKSDRVGVVDGEAGGGRPEGVRTYVGDEVNYPQLIKGDEKDALLGVFAAISMPAAAAMRALDAGDIEEYDRIFGPTLPLARHLFAAPAHHYRAGVVFLNWLAGHQDHLTMVGGAQAGRSPNHLLTLMKLADEAGILPDADLATARARAWLTTVGLD